MRAVTLHAFGVNLYGYNEGNNDNMKKRHDKKNIQIQKVLYFTVFVVKNFEF